ncbi:MAG: flagellar hook-basal body complex protein FliE [Myxococcota bacterium]
MRIDGQNVQAFDLLTRRIEGASSIRGGQRTNEARETAPSEAAESPSANFAETLSDFVSDVNASQESAESASADFADGRSDDIHGTMIKLQEADIKLRLLGNVRNRALEAYREIMRMGA